jgi:putative N6-adenine-specific DNA methylase
MQENLEKRIKRQVHGKLHRFTAVVPLGFEATLVQELRQIGVAAKDDSFETADGKVSFEAKLTEAWKAVAHSRIANRMLMDIASFKAENFRELEKKAAEIPWELYFDERTIASSLQTNDERNNPSISELVTSNSLHIHVTCKHSRLYHSDAVAERFYNVFKGGSLPLVPAPCHPRESGDLLAASATPSAGTPRNAPPQDKPSSQNIFVTLIDDRCTVSLDLA